MMDGLLQKLKFYILYFLIKGLFYLKPSDRQCVPGGRMSYSNVFLYLLL